MIYQNNVFLTFEPDLDSNSNSTTSTTRGPTKFQLSLLTIRHF